MKKKKLSVVHLQNSSSVPKQLKPINNPVCYLTDQINIPAV